MSERDYLVTRAAQERKFASAATDSSAAAIHSAMAAEYERRLLDLEAERQFDRISSSRGKQLTRTKVQDHSGSKRI